MCQFKVCFRMGPSLYQNMSEFVIDGAQLAEVQADHFSSERCSINAQNVTLCVIYRQIKLYCITINSFLSAVIFHL